MPSSKKYFWADYEDEDLLDVRLCDLGLTIKDSWVERPINKLYEELKAKHIRLKPHIWLSTNWFCPDGVPGFAIPFFLAHPRLMQLERAQMLDHNAVAVHCPTSNLFLGSGLFDLAKFKKIGLRTGIASDTGGGTSYSMLKTLADAYKIQQLCGHSINPLESFYWSTLGNALALGLGTEIGSFKIGNFADFIVLNSRATEETEIRMRTCESLMEELFILQTLGDDRFIVSVYIAGRRQK